MAKLSDLQKIGILRREDLRGDYNKNNQYSDSHKDALSDGDANGKGTNSSYVHTTPDSSKSRTQIVHQLDTENGGGLYDIKGYNEVGGREFLESINNYSEGKKDYQKNDNLWKKRSTIAFNAEEYRIPDLNNGPISKPQINVLDGGSELDRAERERAIRINKYSSESDYKGNFLFGTNIEGQAGW